MPVARVVRLLARAVTLGLVCRLGPRAPFSLCPSSRLRSEDLEAVHEEAA